MRLSRHAIGCALLRFRGGCVEPQLRRQISECFGKSGGVAPKLDSNKAQASLISGLIMGPR